MTKYRFPTERTRKAPPISTSGFFDTAQEEEAKGVINGRPAASILEWRVAKALWSMGRSFAYQYPLFGGRSVRGGIVIDFLVEAAPNYIPLEVQGERWHTGQFASDERRRIALIEATLNTTVLFVWENELQSQEAANAAVKKVIGPL